MNQEQGTHKIWHRVGGTSRTSQSDILHLSANHKAFLPALPVRDSKATQEWMRLTAQYPLPTPSFQADHLEVAITRGFRRFGETTGSSSLAMENDLANMYKTQVGEVSQSEYTNAW